MGVGKVVVNQILKEIRFYLMERTINFYVHWCGLSDENFMPKVMQYKPYKTKELKLSLSEDESKRLLKSNDYLWDSPNPHDSLGMCLKVSFVEYNGKKIVYDAIQTETTVDDILAIDRTQIE